MKLSTQAAKHLVKKESGQSTLLTHARLAGWSLCFFSPEGSQTLLLSGGMEKRTAKAKDHQQSGSEVLHLEFFYRSRLADLNMFE